MCSDFVFLICAVGSLIYCLPPSPDCQHSKGPLPLVSHLYPLQDPSQACHLWSQELSHSSFYCPVVTALMRSQGCSPCSVWDSLLVRVVLSVFLHHEEPIALSSFSLSLHPSSCSNMGSRLALLVSDVCLHGN